MNAQEIVTVVGELVADNGLTIAQQHGSQALTVAREMESALVSRLREDQMRMAIWQRFQTDPGNAAPFLVTAVEMLLQADAALARRLDALLEAYQRAAGSTGTTIHTAGGAYVGGRVETSGGDFVGHDQTKITGDGSALGDHPHTTVVKQTADPEAIARAFGELYTRIEARPETPSAQKDDLKAELEEVKEEIAKGEAADEGFIARRLRNVGRMAPDILEVVLAALTNPAAGLGLVAKKVAERIRAETAGTATPAA